jgi:magnesium-transporting ATPase (P-type)
MYTIIESQVGGAQFAQFRRLSNADDEERRAVLIAWKQQAKVRGWSARLSVPSRGGTEVARQAADVILADDDFSTLVEALVEGRGFWRNIRRSLGLLLGGNLGELSLIAGVSVLGFPSPLNSRQILVVNLITDALPALAVVLQRPEHRNLAGLAREGVSALDASLRTDVLRRGAATALPALAAYLLGRGSGGLEAAGAVAFGGVVANQLAQTLDAG